MYIPLEERETIITFNEKNSTASVYTMNGALIRKLDSLTQSRPDDARRAKIYPDGAQEYEVPKKWVKVNVGLILTPEERERRSERGRPTDWPNLPRMAGKFTRFQTLTPFMRQVTRLGGKNPRKPNKLQEISPKRGAHMTAAEKVEAYLDRVLRYLDTPLGQRDPGEYEALMAMKSEIYTMSKGDATT